MKKDYKKKGFKSVKTQKLDKEIKKVVKSELKQEEELKQFIGAVTQIFYFGTTAQTTATLRSMLNMAQNTTDSGRIGDVIKLKALEMRVKFYNNYGAGSNPQNTCRFIVFQYKKDNTTPTISDFFSSGAGSGTTNIYSIYNKDFQDIYTILMDKTVNTAGTFGATGAQTATNDLNKFYQWKVPLKYAQKKIQFKGATIDANNQIYFCILGEFGSNTLNPYITIDWDARYTDA